MTWRCGWRFIFHCIIIKLHPTHRAACACIQKWRKGFKPIHDGPAGNAMTNTDRCSDRSKRIETTRNQKKKRQQLTAEDHTCSVSIHPSLTAMNSPATTEPTTAMGSIDLQRRGCEELSVVTRLTGRRARSRVGGDREIASASVSGAAATSVQSRTGPSGQEPSNLSSPFRPGTVQLCRGSGPGRGAAGLPRPM